jgi:hypothetical protein
MYRGGEILELIEIELHNKIYKINRGRPGLKSRGTGPFTCTTHVF